MKKLLAFVLVLTLLSTLSVSVVGCSKPKTTGTPAADTGTGAKPKT